MKKKVSILITITLILNIVLQVFGNLSFAVTTNQTEENTNKNTLQTQPGGGYCISR